ncbi:MAG: hypothetical protein U9R25_17290 [Chloroflexota bacterium]|nr:hypothetical protein [Chloroflexota bacterium]
MTVEQHQLTGRLEVLAIREGFLIGGLAAIVMAIVAMIISALTGHGFWTPVNAIGGFLSTAPTSQEFDGVTTVVGVAVQLLMGGLLGTLYASAQARIDNPSMLIIAVWYGLIIWFVATFLVFSWLSPGFQEVMKSWSMFLAHLSFGPCLGLYAVSRNPYPARHSKTY